MKTNFLKSICLVVSMLLTGSLFSQSGKTVFYDYQWRPCTPDKARFYSVAKQTDSGWYRQDFFLATKQLQMAALYKDSSYKILNGNVTYFYANGNLESTGRKIDNQIEGAFVSYHNNGIMSDSGFYHHNQFIGNTFSWHRNGMPSDSSFKKNDSIIVTVSWFDNGNPSTAGYFLNNKKQGKWDYFHRNGKLACTEFYNAGKVIQSSFFNEDGVALTDTSHVTSEAMFKGSKTKWISYLENKIYWPPSYKITNSDEATVVVTYDVNEDGKVENVFVKTPFHPLMDKIALDAVQRSPVWIPRTDHNRKVKQRFIQSITFSQPAED